MSGSGSTGLIRSWLVNALIEIQNKEKQKKIEEREKEKENPALIWILLQT